MKQITKTLLVCALTILVATPVFAANNHSNHSGKVTAGIVTGSPTAAGTVYVHTGDGATTNTTASWSCGSSADGDKKSCTWGATTNAGYSMQGWYTDQAGTALKDASTTHTETVDASSSNNITYYAKFVAVGLGNYSGATTAYTSTTDPVSNSITFSTLYANSAADFNNPTFTGSTGGGTWSATLSYSNNQAVITYTFTPSGTAGTYTVTLNFSTKSGASQTITLTAIVTAPALYDTQVLDENGNVISGSEGTLTNAITIAGNYYTTNGKTATIQVLRNFSLASAVNITKPMNLDLCSFTITSSVNQAIKINGTGIEVTIRDSRSGGKIQLTTTTAGWYAVYVSAGTLNIKGGTIAATGNGVANTYGVGVRAGATLNISGGTINAEATTNSRGVYCAGNINVSGEAVINSTTTSTTTAYGIFVDGTTGCLNITGGSVVARAQTTSSFGIYINNAAAQATISNGKVSAISGTTTSYGVYNKGIVNITYGKFSSAATSALADVVNNGAAAKTTISGGYFVHNTNLATYKAENTYIWDVPTAQPAFAEGYRYSVDENAQYGDNVCRIGTTYYKTLEAALQVVNSSTASQVIIMTARYKLPAGNYKLPANASLLIPMNESQNAVKGKTPYSTTSKTTPSLYRELILAKGVNLVCQGTIEICGTQNVGDQGQSYGVGTPSGPYGMIRLEEESSITLESGAKLYVWGFIIGDGNIYAKSGSEIHEDFQVYDWKGGSHTFALLNNSQKVFPVNQYFIQNIEAATTYYPGAELYGSMGINASIVGEARADEIKVIGTSGALFLMSNVDASAGAWVRKRYDAKKDRQIYEVNSSAKLGSLTISVSSYNMQSSKYVLPITNNMSIHLLSGNMGITQSTVLLAGAEIEIDKEATVSIASGQTLFLYDSDQWQKQGHESLYATRIKYTPSWTTCPRNISSPENLGDAKLNVHGTFDVVGNLQTTTSGANIISTNEDAGTIKFTNTAGANSSVYQWVASEYLEAATTSAQLHNGGSYVGTANEYTQTTGTAAGNSYCYIEDKWQCLVTSNCMVIDKTDQANPIYYAKPGDYVALNNGTEDANHLYHSADGTRTFILCNSYNDVDCQWWEVEYEADNVYYCKDNDTYFTYSDGDWIVKTVKITWNTGSTNKVYNAAYRSTPVYLDATPTKASSGSTYYVFEGWSPDIVPATENATYTAVFKAETTKYDITWKNDDGTILQITPTISGEVPAYTGDEPLKIGTAENEYSFIGWSPVITAATAAKEYTAQYEAHVKEFGEQLDIVNWTSNSLTINVKDYISKASGADWKIVVIGNTYTKADRAADRTLTISGLTLTADATILIKALSNSGVVESQRYYKIPHIISSNTSINNSNVNSTLWIKSGYALTMNQNAQVGTIVVEPGAELIIASGKRVVCNKLVMKTKAFSSASLKNNGTLVCTNMYYTRIVADKSQAYQLALPFSCDLTGVTFSNGRAAQAGTHYGLQYYDADGRAANGIANNWIKLSGTTLAANTGYQILSSSAYYCEYYFPVSYEKTAVGQSINVATQQVGATEDRGWNFIALPYTYEYTCTQASSDPEEQVKICTLNTDNKTFTQDIPSSLKPASPFYYQASQNGRLIFGSQLEFSSTARAAGVAASKAKAADKEPKLATQWLRLHYEDQEGNEDVTNLFMSPNFTTEYEQGYDVSKLSTMGEKPFIYTTLPYGDMAFCALQDTVAEQGVALTVFTPSEQSMRIYLDDNNHMRRMKHVYLLDDSLHQEADLLKEDYVFAATEGTTSSRFYLKMVFKLPSEMTDLNDATNNGGSSISWNGEEIHIDTIDKDQTVSIYDVAGRMIGSAQDIEHAHFAVPTTGVYLIKIGSEVQKVVLNK